MDILSALKDGYSKSEVMEELGRRTGMNYKQALSDGYSEDDVLGELNRRDLEKKATQEQQTPGPPDGGKVPGAAGSPKLEESWGTGFKKAAKSAGYQTGQAIGGLVHAIEEESLDTLARTPFELASIALKPFDWAAEKITGRPVKKEESPAEAVSDLGKTITSPLPDIARKPIIGSAEKAIGIDTPLGKTAGDFWAEKAKESAPVVGDNKAKKHILGAAQSVIPATVAAGSAILARKPNVALNYFFGSSFGQEYDEQRRAGTDPAKAMAGGLISGTAEKYTEKIPLDALMKEGGNILARAVKSTALDIPGELLATTFQEGLVKKATTNPNFSLSDYWEALKDTAIQTAIAGPVQAGSVHPVVKFVEREHSNAIQEAVNQGKHSELSDEDLSNVLRDASKLSQVRPKDKGLQDAVVALQDESLRRKGTPSLSDAINQGGHKDLDDASLEAAIQTASELVNQNPNDAETFNILNSLQAEAEARKQASLETETIMPQVETKAEQAAPDYSALITTHAEQNGIEPSLLSAVAQADGGLMAISPQVAQYMGMQDAQDPDQNLEGGARYLSALLQHYQGNEVKALAAYKLGVAAVSDQFRIESAPKEVQDYIASVQNLNPTGLIDSGLRTGQVNGQPFGPNEAVSLIQQKMVDGTFTKDDLTKLKDQHPSLISPLNDLITESLKAEISQAVGITTEGGLQDGQTQKTETLLNTVSPYSHTMGAPVSTPFGQQQTPTYMLGKEVSGPKFAPRPETPPAPLTVTNKEAKAVTVDAKSGGSLIQADVPSVQTVTLPSQAAVAAPSIGQSVSWSRGKETFSGTVKAVGKNGTLKIAGKNGKTYSIRPEKVQGFKIEATQTPNVIKNSWVMLGKEVSWEYTNIDRKSETTSLKPRADLLKQAAESLGISFADAQRALAAYNYGDEGQFSNRPVPTIKKRVSTHTAPSEIVENKANGEAVISPVIPQTSENIPVEGVGKGKTGRDLAKIAESAIIAFPDMNQTSEGLIPLSRFTPEEAQSMRDAGIVEVATSSQEGYEYEGVNDEYLWERRKQIQNERKAQKVSQVKQGESVPEKEPIVTAEKSKKKGPQNIITRILAEGGLNVQSDYSNKYLKQYPDLKRAIRNTGISPDDMAAILKDDGYLGFDSGDELVELLKEGKGKETFTPENLGDKIESQIRSLENEWIEQELANLEAEGIDAGRMSKSSGDLLAGFEGKIAEEGLSEADAEAALDELSDFFESVAPAKETTAPPEKSLKESYTEKAKAGTLETAEIPGASFAETFALAPSPGTLGEKPKPHLKNPTADMFATKGIEEREIVAPEAPEKQKEVWEMSKDEYRAARKERHNRLYERKRYEQPYSGKTGWENNDAVYHKQQVKQALSDGLPVPPEVLQDYPELEKANTEDSGAELTYNKRNRIKTGIKWEDIVDKNAALQIKETTKQNIYPRPDYQKLVDDGMPSLVAHLVKQVYDSIPVGPVLRKDATDDDLKLYITAVNRVMEGVIGWSGNTEALAAWAKKQANIAGAALGRGPVSIHDTFADVKSLLDTVYPNGWKEYMAEIKVLGGNKLLHALQPGYTETKKAISEIDKGWPAKQEAWQKRGWKVVATKDRATIKGDWSGKDENGEWHKDQYGVTVENHVYGKLSKTKEEAEATLATLKPYLLLDKYGRIKEQFDTEEAAKDFIREKTRREGKTSTVKDKGISVEMAQRTGLPEHRLDGENITSDQLKDAFGFKGVNFGNWMKGDSNTAERQLHLNHAYDSFLDLADILGVPPKAMSLNGMLGLAIGAQGTGAHAAHFVPGVNEINLTRTSGAGSLGHEFGHALDHYFGKQAGLEANKEPFLTEHVGTVDNEGYTKRAGKKVKAFGEGIRPEIAGLFAGIVERMNHKSLIITPEQLQAERQSMIDVSKGRIKGWLKSIRADFERQKGTDLEAFDKLADRILNLDLGEGKVSAGGRTYFHPVVAELRDLYKKASGRVYSIEQMKGLQANLDHYAYLHSERSVQNDHTPQARPARTDYARNAAALDAAKGGKPYWNTDVEKFARAFDAFISDTLEQKATANTYLSHAGRTGETVPEGNERKTINEAFQKLVDEIKTRETDTGVEMYSLKEEEYGEISTGGVTESDLKDLFPGQKIEKVGNLYVVTTKGGGFFLVENVERIDRNNGKVMLGYGRKMKQNEVISGSYLKGEIKISKSGDVWTLAHESIHYLEDAGLLDERDIAVLKAHVRRLVANKQFKTNNRNDIGGAEDRADFLMDAMSQRPKYTGLVGRVMDKVYRIVDAMGAMFGKRTVGSIIREVKSGEVYNKPVTRKLGMPLAEPSESDINRYMTSRKGTGDIPPKKTQQPEGGKKLSDDILSIINDAKNNGTYLKAPNGELTKLTPSLWGYVRTDEFKVKFGDWETDSQHSSLCVDGNGEPLLTYHGTNDHFSTFSKSELGKATGAKSASKGFFFVDNSLVPKGYTLNAAMSGKGDLIGRHNRARLDYLRRVEEETEKAVSKDQDYMAAESSLHEIKRARESYLGTLKNVSDGLYVPDTAYMRLELKYPLVKDYKDAILNEYRRIYSTKTTIRTGYDGNYSGDFIGQDNVRKLNESKKRIQDQIHARVSQGLIEEYSKKARSVERLQTKEAFLVIKNPTIKDFAGSSYRDEEYSVILNRARRRIKGEKIKDGVILQNTFDGVADYNPGTAYNVFVVFSPDQIILVPEIDLPAPPAPQGRPEGGRKRVLSYAEMFPGEPLTQSNLEKLRKYNSNLKIDYTETREFKSRFRGSKVVDSKGRPLMLYHGTGQKLTEITPGMDEPGAWFTTNRLGASSYAKGDDPNVYSVYLNAQKPFVADFSKGYSQETHTIKISGMVFDDNIPIVEYAEQNGYDSVHFKHGNFSEDSETWVVFSSDQVIINPDPPNPSRPPEVGGQDDVAVKERYKVEQATASPEKPRLKTVEELVKWLNDQSKATDDPFTETTRKQSSLSKKTYKQALESTLIAEDKAPDVLEYDVMPMQEQADLAADLINKDIAKAKRIALGQEEPEGKLRKGTVYRAVELWAHDQGDTELIAKLIRSPISLEMTKQGQEIAATRKKHLMETLGMKYYESPVNAVRDVEDTLRENVEKKTGKKVSKEAEAEAEAWEKKFADLNKTIAEQAAEIKKYTSQEYIDELIKKHGKEGKPRTVKPRAEYGAKNKVVTRESYEQAKQEWHKMFGSTQLHAGIDPSAIAALTKIGTYHFEAGARQFAAWAQKVVDDTHPSVKPYLKEVFEKAKSAFGQSLTQKIKKGIEKGRDLGELQRHVTDLTISFIEEGITDGNEVVEAVHNELKQIDPEITLEETRDAISGYGKWKPLTHDDVLDRYREIKQEQQLVAKLRDLQEKGTIEKTGRERQEMTPLARDLTKQVNELKKKYGLSMTDPETQLRSALEAYKRRLEQQIADLDREIDTKQKIVRERYDLPLDQEAKELKAERDRKKEIRDSIFGKPELSGEQRLRLALQSAKRSAAEYARRIAEHDFSPLLKNREALTSEALEKAKQDRDEARKAYQELREAEHPGEAAMKALDTRLHNELNRYKQMISNRDFSKQERKPRNLTPELKRLMEQRDNMRMGVRAAAEAAGRLTNEDIERIAKLASVVTELREAMDNGGDRLAYGAAMWTYHQYVQHLKGADAPIGKLIQQRWEQAKTTKKEEGTARAIGDGVGDTLKLASDTAVTTAGSLDDSFIFRQGMYTLLKGEYRIWGRAAAKSFIDIYNSLRARDSVAALMADYYSRPNYLNGNYHKAGIQARHEEEVATDLPERMYVLGRLFKASNAAFNGSALRMRMDLFDKYHQEATDNGADVNDKLVEDFGKLAGSLTQRAFAGKVKDPKSVTNILRQTLDAILWAPKMLEAEYNIITVHSLGAGLSTGYARKKALANTLKIGASIFAITSVTAAILALTGDDDDEVIWNVFDPRFLQIRAGGKYFDPTAKLGSLVSFIARMAFQKKYNSETGVYTAYEGVVGKQSVFYAIIDFLANKTKPLTKVFIDYAKDRDFEGRKPTVANSLYGAYMPIPIQNAVENMKSDAEARWLSVIADFIGIGTQEAGVWPEVWRPDKSKKMEQLLKNLNGDEKAFQKLNDEYNKRVQKRVKELTSSPNWGRMSSEGREKALKSEKARIKAYYVGD